MVAAISLYTGLQLNRYLTAHNIFMPAPVVVMLSNDYKSMKALDYLSEFNKKCDNKLLSFSFGLRPIIINVVDNITSEDDEYSGLGVTYMNPGYCYIELSDSLADYELRVVLLHELLHCYNVPHSPEEFKGQGDLMEPYLGDRLPTEQNIDYYLRVLYEKRGLRP